MELAHGGRGPSSSDRRGYGGGGGGGGGGAGGGRFGVSRHSEYRGVSIMRILSFDIEKDREQMLNSFFLSRLFTHLAMFLVGHHFDFDLI